MDIINSNMTVADYCDGMNKLDILVNKNYQRSDQVWPGPARSFLIETVLLNYPMPKLSLHQRTDTATRKTVKEIVDGQQRSTALLDFFNDRLRLSPTLSLAEAAGRRYSQLDDTLKAQFLGYSLSVDLFIAASEEEVREVFRRMNSYTVPLNPEEQRHANRQGPFKWFIHNLSRDLDEALLEYGTFGQKQLVRMADSKLLTEVVVVHFDGVPVYSRKRLDDIYKRKDVEFPEQEELDRRVRAAFAFVTGLPELHGTALMKPSILYSLLIAVMHYLDPIETVSEWLPPVQSQPPLERDDQVANLTALAEALDEPEASDFSKFAHAAVAGTNTEANRRTRIRWLYSALTSQLPL
jgi:hypothetical protein